MTIIKDKEGMPWLLSKTRICHDYYQRQGMPWLLSKTEGTPWLLSKTMAMTIIKAKVCHDYYQSQGTPWLLSKQKVCHDYYQRQRRYAMTIIKAKDGTPGLSKTKPRRTYECGDLKEISGKLVRWKDPTNPKGECGPSPNQQARYFFQISAWTLFMALSHTFHGFQTHLVGYISKL